MFSARLSLPTLIDLCRMLRHQLSAGLTLHQVMTQQSQRGPGSVRSLAGRVSDAIRGGSSLSKALEPEKDAFPPLFLSLIKVGEATGHLAEIFGELERYYQLELQLRRQFRSQTFLPVLQFVAAVFLFAGLIYILGFIAAMTNTTPRLTIFGRSGGSGALAFLGLVFGSVALAWLLFRALRWLSGQKAWMDRFLLSLPAVGPCLTALVMSRFALALQLTLDTGISIHKALRLALNATGNAHFASHADRIALALKNGQSLHEALATSGLFTPEFLMIVASAEASGQVPEMMRHQAEQYHEEAARQMSNLTKVSALLVWGTYAAFMIWAIFSLASIYLGALAG